MPKNNIPVKKDIVSSPRVSKDIRLENLNRNRMMLELLDDDYAVVLSQEVMEHRMNGAITQAIATVFDVMQNEIASKERLTAVSKTIELAKYIDSRKPQVDPDEDRLEDDISLNEGIDDATSFYDE